MFQSLQFHSSQTRAEYPAGIKRPSDIFGKLKRNRKVLGSSLYFLSRSPFGQIQFFRCLRDCVSLSPSSLILFLSSLNLLEDGLKVSIGNPSSHSIHRSCFSPGPKSLSPHLIYRNRFPLSLCLSLSERRCVANISTGHGGTFPSL